MFDPAATYVSDFMTVDLLERDAALAALGDAFASAKRGDGRLVSVSGEPGIGKTSLVRSFTGDLEEVQYVPVYVQREVLTTSLALAGTLISPTAILRAPDAGIDLSVSNAEPDSIATIVDYRIEGPQVSLDKQYVRDWLRTQGWNREPPAPSLPHEVVNKTSEKYLDAYKRVTRRDLLAELPPMG